MSRRQIAGRSCGPKTGGGGFIEGIELTPKTPEACGLDGLTTQRCTVFFDMSSQ